MTGLDTDDLKDVNGLVLREFSYKESSKILEVFTDKLGRISIMARGVLRKNSKNLGLSQRFTLANFSLYRSGKKFYGIKDGTIKKSYFKSPSNFDIILYMSAIADLLTRTIDTMQVETVYKLLVNTFEAFDKASKNQVNIFLAFLIKYASFSGFKPNFTSCGICGRPIDLGEIYFSTFESSAICKSCKSKAHGLSFLSKEEYLYFNKILYTKSEELEKIRPVKSYAKVGKIIIDYCLRNLDIKKFSSMDWVAKALERNMNVL